MVQKGRRRRGGVAWVAGMETTHVLETEGLSHRFGGVDVLRDVNLAVPAGAIHGFLGPNGAGKTTTLRLVLGLLRRQEGSIRLWGRPLEAHRLEVLRRIGAMIESPSIYGHLTAEENLRVLQRIHGCRAARIGEVLRVVGLAGTGAKKAARFSLGMKQRLGIAMALLHEPDFLILDEPTNGLDPNGMIEIRELLRELNRAHGITLLVSSHLLGEIEKMVSHVGIIHRGRILFQGTLGELQRAGAGRGGLVLATGQPEKTAAVLRGRGLAAEWGGDGFRLPAREPVWVAGLVRELVAAGIDVHAISPHGNDLEGIFMEMITEGSAVA